MHPHELTEYPGQVMTTDLFTWDNQNYMVVADIYFHWLEVKELPNIKGLTIVMYTKAIFSRIGVPQRLYYECGACYQSREFTAFSKQYDSENNYQIITTLPAKQHI